MISYFDAFESKVGRVVIRISLTEDPLLEEKAGGEGGEGKESIPCHGRNFQLFARLLFPRLDDGRKMSYVCSVRKHLRAFVAHKFDPQVKFFFSLV